MRHKNIGPPGLSGQNGIAAAPGHVGVDCNLTNIASLHDVTNRRRHETS